MKKITIITLVILGTVVLYACKKSFLDVKPQGVLDEATLSSEKGINKLLLSAYAMLDGHDGGLSLGGEWGSGGSNFVFGGMGGGEANKGSDPGDQENNMKNVIRHEYTPTNGALNDRWKALYEGVKRTNTVLEFLTKIGDLVSADAQKNISGQAHLLRAWYHFQARITFGKVPYLDEKTDIDLASDAIKGVANDEDIFPKIVADAKFAYENLPEKQDAVGRLNKWAAGAIYGKILMFTKDYATAKTVLTDVVNNGANSLGVKYDLNTNYDDNFNLAFDNSKESVFAFQSSSLDNASARNSNWGDLLNTPATDVGGAGFYTPTYFFTNHFKTDASGLPVANPQNTEVFDPFSQAGLTRYTGSVDTRLDWTIGRDGIPFYDWDVYLTSWPRDKSAGPYAGKKTLIRKAQIGSTHDASIWFAGGGVALNLNLIRFSDVILLLAEAEIESGGSLSNAFDLINRVRTRAMGSRTVKTFVDPTDPTKGFTNTDAASYKVAPYPTVFATPEEARTAVRLERLLELGMEGGRFFDLVRWGIAATEITDYYNYESPMPYQVLLKPKPVYDPAKADYYAIPQQQVDLSNGFIKP